MPFAFRLRKALDENDVQMMSPLGLDLVMLVTVDRLLLAVRLMKPC